MKMKKVLTIVIFALAISLVAGPAVSLAQYGEEEIVKVLQLDKEVWNPETEEFVDNLGLNDYRFAPGEKIFFKLTIKNVGDRTFDKVDLRDYLPEYLELFSGDLSFEINDLVVDETEERRFEAKVVSAENFPNDKSIICVVNTAEAWSGDERDKDTAQICLEKKVLGVTTLPPTGPSNWLLALVSAAAMGSLGFYLLKFSN